MTDHLALLFYCWPLMCDLKLFSKVMSHFKEHVDAEICLRNFSILKETDPAVMMCFAGECSPTI